MKNRPATTATPTAALPAAPHSPSSGTDTERSTLRCPACSADNAVRVSEEELALVTGYVKLRSEARELIRQRIAESRTKGT